MVVERLRVVIQILLENLTPHWRRWGLLVPRVVDSLEVVEEYNAVVGVAELGDDASPT